MPAEQVEGVLLNSQTRAVTVFFATFALLGLVFAGFNIHQAGRLIVGAAVFVVLVITAVRTAKSSITWDRQGLVSRWTGTTRRLAWSEIAGFEYREAGGLGARLPDGRWVRLMPYPRGPLNQPERAIAALEAGRQAARTGHGEQGTPPAR